MQSDCGEKEYPLLQIKVFVVKFIFQACVEVSFDFLFALCPSAITPWYWNPPGSSGLLAVGTEVRLGPDNEIIF